MCLNYFTHKKHVNQIGGHGGIEAPILSVLLIAHTTFTAPFPPKPFISLLGLMEEIVHTICV